MDSKEIQELLKLVNRLELAEFKYKQGETEFSVRTKYYSRSRGYEMMPSMPPMPVSHQMPQSPQSTTSAPSSTKSTSESENGGNGAPAVAKDNLVEIRSPIVGTFYRSPSPDKPVYVKPGDTIEVGTVVCIVEAMKLFNEIESEVTGKIVKVLVDNSTPVEYDQPLFLVEPK